MHWNDKALECQVNCGDAAENEMSSQILIAQLFLDVDCSHLNYSTPVSEEVLAAAKKVKRITFDILTSAMHSWQD